MSRNTACRVVPLFRPYRAQVAAIVGLIAVTSTIGIIDPLLTQAVFNKALFIPGGPNGIYLLAWLSLSQDRASGRPRIMGLDGRNRSRQQTVRRARRHRSARS